VEQTKVKLNGLGKSFRYVMSNRQGKIEILGSLSKEKMLFKFHEAKEEQNHGRFFMKEIDENQCWIE
jgi:hypothetical protein